MLFDLLNLIQKLQEKVDNICVENKVLWNQIDIVDTRLSNLPDVNTTRNGANVHARMQSKENNMHEHQDSMQGAN